MKTTPWLRSDVQKKISLKSGWRKGPFCYGKKARASHDRYVLNAPAHRKATQ